MKREVAMYFNLSAKIERLYYKAACVNRFYYCRICEDLVLVELRPTGVYRSCDQCKRCQITIKSESTS